MDSLWISETYLAFCIVWWKVGHRYFLNFWKWMICPPMSFRELQKINKVHMQHKNTWRCYAVPPPVTDRSVPGLNGPAFWCVIALKRSNVVCFIFQLVELCFFPSHLAQMFPPKFATLLNFCRERKPVDQRWFASLRPIFSVRWPIKSQWATTTWMQDQTQGGQRLEAPLVNRW